MAMVALGTNICEGQVLMKLLGDEASPALSSLFF